MSVNIPDHFMISFSTNMELLLQQKGSKLRGTMMEGHHTGKSASPVDQFGSVEMSEVTSRFAPKQRTDINVDRRWVNPIDFDLSQMVDTFDKLRILTDPESPQSTAAVYAAGRKIDRIVIAAFTGTAKTGEQGGTSTIFTAGNEVDVAEGGANSRLNVAKLLKVKELMGENFVDFDMDTVYVGLTAKDNAALLNEVQIVSSDFNKEDKPVLSKGRVDSFLGMQMVHCQLIESVAAGTNEVNVPVWAKSGMYIGFWDDIKSSMGQRKELRGEPFENYMTATFGATRLEENKVYNIESYRA